MPAGVSAAESDALDQIVDERRSGSEAVHAAGDTVPFLSSMMVVGMLRYAAAGAPGRRRNRPLVSHFCAVEKRLHHGVVLVGVDRQEHDVVAVAETLLHFFVERMLGAAGNAPGGPEIEHHHFALQLDERQLVAVQARERELACGSVSRGVRIERAAASCAASRPAAEVRS